MLRNFAALPQLKISTQFPSVPVQSRQLQDRSDVTLKTLRIRFISNLSNPLRLRANDSDSYLVSATF